jgi:hypothetical protein
MLRSLAETVGGGCFVTNGEVINLNNVSGSCNNVESLCVACRMFGMMERQSNARVHKGNISISDAILQEKTPGFVDHEIYLGGPAVRHRSFYLTPDTDRFDGKSRKFYFHQPGVNESFPVLSSKIKERAWTVRALTPGHNFNFQVFFSNLREEEFALLIYILALEDDVKVSVGGESGMEPDKVRDSDKDVKPDNDKEPDGEYDRKTEQKKFELRGPLRHKIGNAKPLGMGSSHISITKLECYAEPLARFTSFSCDKGVTLEEDLEKNSGKKLENEIQNIIRPFTQDHCTTMEHLRKMMVWDETDKRIFKYPDWSWFETPGNSEKKLKNIALNHCFDQ